MQDYLKFWGIKKPAFKELEWETPPFVPNSGLALLQRVILQCEHATQLMMMTAPDGHGKSTTARWIYQALPLQQFEVALFSLYQNESEPGWLLPRLAAFFHSRRQEGEYDHDACLNEVSAGLDELAREKRRLVVIIDDAHKLKTSESLEEIQILLSLQSVTGGLISVVLIGKDELADVVSASDGLRHRLGFKWQNAPLTPEESCEYMQYRLEVAGLSPTTLTEAAMLQIGELSNGIYNVINLIVENAFMEAFLQKDNVIDRDIVLAAWNYLPHEQKAQLPDVPPPAPLEMPLAAGDDDPSPQPRKTVSSQRSESPSPAKNEKSARQDTNSSVKLSSLFYKNKN